MVVIDQEFTMFAGDEITLRFVFTDRDGNALDVSTASAGTFEFTQSSGVTTYSSVDVTSGDMTVDLLAALTSGVTAYEIATWKATLTLNSDTQTVACGRCKIRA